MTDLTVTDLLTAEDLANLKKIEAGEAKLRKREDRALRINLDQAWAERSVQAFEFELDGKLFPVPGAMPARVFMYLWRNLMKPMGEGRFAFEIPDELFVETLETVLGKEFAEAALASEKSIRFVTAEVLLPVLRVWGFPIGGGDEPESGNGEKKTESTPGSSSGAGLS